MYIPDKFKNKDWDGLCSVLSQIFCNRQIVVIENTRVYSPESKGIKILSIFDLVVYGKRHHTTGHYGSDQKKNGGRLSVVDGSYIS